MRRRLVVVLLVSVLLSSSPVFALSPGRDVLVPAAARIGLWVTDLYVMNPGTSVVPVTVSWLARDQANPNPLTIHLDLRPGETAVLDDVILQDFGYSTGSGAFRVEADDDVLVNARIYAVDGSSTFGQGFEGVPAGAVTSAGQQTAVVGLSQGLGFRTNVYALAGADGAALSFILTDPAGAEITAANLELAGFEPYLRRVDWLFPGLGDLADGTLRVSVTSGSAVVGASKVDETSSDPTTLESSVVLGAAASADGRYQISAYDSFDFAGGGNLEVVGNRVTRLTATYFNWDKQDAAGLAECTELFLITTSFDPPVAVEDFADGVVVEQGYQDGSVMTFTVTLSISANLDLAGWLDAVGSGFPLVVDGCNGTFPPLTLVGGKSR